MSSGGEQRRLVLATVSSGGELSSTLFTIGLRHFESGPMGAETNREFPAYAPQ
jgi:hypothetical protein